MLMHADYSVPHPSQEDNHILQRKDTFSHTLSTYLWLMNFNLPFLEVISIYTKLMIKTSFTRFSHTELHTIMYVPILY